MEERSPGDVRPGPGRESVWDYPRPPRVEPVAAELIVEWRGMEIARTRRGVRVVETAGAPVYYFPPEDVRTDLLRPGGRRTHCEWKGWASYWTLEQGGDRVRDAAWSYPDPASGYEAIRDRLAFYAGRVDRCRVGGLLVRPQAGGFYGGWVTPDLVGPIKGEPGTESW